VNICATRVNQHTHTQTYMNTQKYCDFFWFVWLESEYIHKAQADQVQFEEENKRI